MACNILALVYSDPDHAPSVIFVNENENENEKMMKTKTKLRRKRLNDSLSLKRLNERIPIR